MCRPAPRPASRAGSAGVEGFVDPGLGLLDQRARGLLSMTVRLDAVKGNVEFFAYVIFRACRTSRLALAGEAVPAAQSVPALARIPVSRPRPSRGLHPHVAELGPLAGLSQATIRAIGERVHTHGTELNQAFPELQSLGHRARGTLILDAIRRDDAAMAVVKRVSNERAGDDPDTVCTTKCFVYFIFELTAELICAIQRLALCTLLVFPPLVVLCGAIAIALMIDAMADANREYTECIEDCQQSGQDVG
jgi:hypothetical protein